MMKEISNKMLPHDVNIEKIVLGTLISNRFAFNEVREVLNEDCFYLDFHKRIFSIIKEIESRGDEPDIVLIYTEYSKKHGGVNATDITELAEHQSYVNCYKHSCILRDLHIRRTIINLGIQMQYRGYSEIEDVSDISKYAQDEIKNLFTQSDSAISNIMDAIKGVYAIVDKNKSSDHHLTGSPTGFYQFDKKSGGLQKTDLMIIAGETSQGKTSFALSILNHTVKTGTKVAVYSLEMNKEQLAARLMAQESGVPANQILFAPLADHQFEILDKSIRGLCNSTILFDDRSSSNIDTIINSIRSMVSKYEIDGVVIDYLQILNVNMKSANKEQQMADVARRLKNLAKDLNIWIIALSQLSRDPNNPQPTLNRLRDSGQIGEAADIVALVYRPEVYGSNKTFPEPFSKYDTNGLAMIDIAKGRNIGTFRFLARFNGETTQFTDADSLQLIDHKKASDVPF